MLCNCTIYFVNLRGLARLLLTILYFTDQYFMVFHRLFCKWPIFKISICDFQDQFLTSILIILKSLVNSACLEVAFPNIVFHFVILCHQMKPRIQWKVLDYWPSGSGDNREKEWIHSPETCQTRQVYYGPRAWKFFPSWSLLISNVSKHNIRLRKSRQLGQCPMPPY